MALASDEGSAVSQVGLRQNNAPAYVCEAGVTVPKHLMTYLQIERKTDVPENTLLAGDDLSWQMDMSHDPVSHKLVIHYAAEAATGGSRALVTHAILEQLMKESP